MSPSCQPSDDLVSSLLPLVDRNYPKTRLDRSHAPPVTQPFNFYDRHIGSHLTLKSIQIVPSLHQSLADSAIDHLIKFGGTDYKLKPSHLLTNLPERPSQRMRAAASVASAYKELFGKIVTLAGKMIFTPTIAEWMPLYGFYLPDSKEGFCLEAGARLNEHGHEFDLFPYDKDELPSTDYNAALDLAMVFPRFAAWFFFPLTDIGQNILKSMTPTSTFDWEYPHTSGITQAASYPIPLDATKGFAIDIIEKHLNVSEGIMSNRNPPLPPYSESTNITIPVESKSSYIPISKDYIQRAWLRAVNEDMTFMIFNCGSHERIGIRHRASQTLFLSDLIDTVSTNPYYGRIHLGLHLAIALDTLARKDTRKAFDLQHGTSLRTVGSMFDVDEDMPWGKKGTEANTPAPTLLNSADKYQVDEVEREISGRDVLLISCDYNDYRSYRPSCFLRVGTSCVQGLFTEAFEAPTCQDHYVPSEYMRATLRLPTGTGAVGTAHRATVQVQSHPGVTLTHTCLVKLSFTPDKWRSLLNEFKTYEYLAKTGVVSGILRVYGLFQDTQTKTLAMLMEYGGEDLRSQAYRRDNSFDGSYIEVDKDEWDTMRRAIQQIHDAGVIHNDIRLANILVNSSHEFSIIDFDQAKLSSNHNHLAYKLDIDIEDFESDIRFVEHP